MSEESVEFVKRGYEALASADPLTVWTDPAWADLVALEAEFDLSAAYPDGPILRGVESWRGYADSSPRGRSLKFEPERFFDVDDERVLVFVRVTAEGEGSGVPVETRAAHEVTIRDGVVVRLKTYANRAEALEAAGLSE